MEWLNVALSLVSSSGVGAILGVIGGIIQRREERKNLELQYSHQETMATLQHSQQLDMIVAEGEQIELAGEQRVRGLEAEAFSKSQESRSGKGDFVKACIRPLILAVLFAMLFFIMRNLGLLTLNEALFTAAEVADLQRAVVYMVLSLTSMGVSWYFCQRPSKQFDKMLSAVTPRQPRTR